MNKKNKTGIVYSTNPNFEFKYENEEEATISKEDQILGIHIERHRAGKTVVIIKNFIGTKKDLTSLSKMLKKKCGVGGSVKNREIIIQGDIRDLIIDILKKEGYKYKKIGG